MIYFALIFIVIFLVVRICKWLKRWFENTSKKIEAQEFAESNNTDLQVLDNELTSLGITPPSTDNSDPRWMLQVRVDMLKKHYSNELYKMLHEHNLQGPVKLASSESIVWNDEIVMIESMVYNFFDTLMVDIDGGKTTYVCSYKEYFTRKYATFTLEEVLQFMKYTTSFEQILNCATIIPTEDMFWRLEKVMRTSQKITAPIGDTVAGAVLFGLPGALIGFAGSDKRLKEQDKSIIVILTASRKRFVVASFPKSETDFEETFHFLNKHFPHRRLEDQKEVEKNH